MTRKLRKIALGTVAIAAVIVVATGQVSTHQAQVWFQAANALTTIPYRANIESV
jgi:hypothetical protein